MRRLATRLIGLRQRARLIGPWQRDWSVCLAVRRGARLIECQLSTCMHNVNQKVEHKGACGASGTGVERSAQEWPLQAPTAASE